jgi:hypothetical protein
MLNLLETYYISEIFVFIVVLCIAIKEVVTFFDWANSRLKKEYDEGQEKEEEIEKVEQEIVTMSKTFEEKEKVFTQKKEEIMNNFGSLNDQIKELKEDVEMLIDSDRDCIKSYIVEKHYFFCYEQKWIDEYSLDCLEKRYAHYIQERGNSYVERLMLEIRALPKYKS